MIRHRKIATNDASTDFDTLVEHFLGIKEQQAKLAAQQREVAKQISKRLMAGDTPVALVTVGGQPYEVSFVGTQLAAVDVPALAAIVGAEKVLPLATVAMTKVKDTFGSEIAVKVETLKETSPSVKVKQVG